MSKQYMTIQTNGGETATIKTNSEKAIKLAIKKIYGDMIGEGAIKSFVIKGDVIEFVYTEEKQVWGLWQPTRLGRVIIIENTFVTEETTEETTEVVTEETAEVIAIISAKRQRVAKLIATTYRKLMDSLRTCDGKNMVYHRQLERLGNVELTLFNSYISTK